MKKQFRAQGDVGIVSGIETNANFSPLPKDGLVIAWGEVTGHKHTIVAEPESIVEFGKDENGVYLINVKKGQAKLTHNKHDVQVLERSIHAFSMQFEYDEVEERRVLD